MYCKCSKGNQYNIVGIGDVPSFNQTAGPNAWTQVTVPEILPLPDCYPDIEDLERIYVNVVIEDVRMVKTPIPEVTPTEEGLTITGNKVVVDGNICQTVVYTADNRDQSLHSINFKYPFCVSIVLPPSTVTPDPATLDYCVDVLVEDVYAKALNERTICKCVTLFLVPKVATVQC